LGSVPTAKMGSISRTSGRTGRERGTMQCFHCRAETVDGASFCVACGGRLTAPRICPGCQSDVPAGARFCAQCGLALLSARPAAPAASSPAPSTSNAGETAPRAEASEEDAQAVLRRESAKLPAVAPAPRSSVGSNVLVFVAVLALLVVGIYVANKGKPKEATMFGGGAPPAAADAPAAPDAPNAPGGSAPAGPPVSGVVRVEPSEARAEGGILFIIARPSARGGKGPPLAVERVASPVFPLEFELGADDRMIAAMPWAGPLDVTARLDRDGNAQTEQAADLTSGPGATNVELGRDDLEIVLRPGASP